MFIKSYQRAFLAACVAAFLLAFLTPAQTPVQTAPPAGDISGAWHFVNMADDGPHESDATFKFESGQVTGKWADADVKGTYQDGQLDLEFPFNYAQGGLAGSMHLKGKLAEGKLSGTWEYAGYTGTFTATRPT
jgi:hypothetical protein